MTGSDVRVTHTVRDTDWRTPFLSVFAVAWQAEAGWDAAGHRTAFARTPGPLNQGAACVCVYDAATEAMTRTASGLLPS